MGSEKTEARRSVKKQLTVWAAVMLTIVLLNVIAWRSRSFSDFYSEKIFPVITFPTEYLTSLFPFSLGEILILLGVIIVIIGIPAAIVCAVIMKKRRGKILRSTAWFLAWVLVYIAGTETLNCFMLYHNTEAADKYFPLAERQYTTAQLTKMCEYIIARADELAEMQTRDENGVIILPDDLYDRCGTAAKDTSQHYPMMGGYAPHPKKILFSRFMSQMDLQGLYLPFTMETTYNPDICPSRVPCTICHEIAHARGYIREDEATFISCCACIGSGDDLLMYSGYLTAMNYSVNMLWKYISDDEKVRISALISDRVRSDNKFLPDEYRESLEAKTVFKTETVSKVTDKAMNTSLKMNGVQDGKKSYSRMVDLLLMYYYENEPESTE